MRLENLLNHNLISKEDREAINWAPKVMFSVDKCHKDLQIYTCNVLVNHENKVIITVLDWYDGMIGEFGAPQLGVYFNLTPVEGHKDMYASLLSPKITGNKKIFLKNLMYEANALYHWNYKFDVKNGILTMNFIDE